MNLCIGKEQSECYTLERFVCTWVPSSRWDPIACISVVLGTLRSLEDVLMLFELLAGMPPVLLLISGGSIVSIIVTVVVLSITAGSHHGSTQSSWYSSANEQTNYGSSAMDAHRAAKTPNDNGYRTAMNAHLRAQNAYRAAHHNAVRAHHNAVRHHR